MGFYNDFILPRLINLAMRNKELRPFRERVIGAAEGGVLEIGVGSQDRLTPAWRYFGGGCHLKRPIRSMIEAAGFRIDRIETGYISGPKPMTCMSEGNASPG